MIRLMKNELGWQIMKKLDGLKAKMSGYLKDNNDEDKKAKDTKRWIIKTKLKSKDYKKCLKASQIENRINYLEKQEIYADSLKEYKKNS